MTSTTFLSPRAFPPIHSTPSTNISPRRPPFANTPAPPTPPPRLSNSQVILQRLTDTLLDARLHYTRLFIPEEPLPYSTSTSTPRLVILGTGWAAHSLIKVLDASQIPDTTIISPRNFFFFTPLLSATAVGTIEFRSIVEPIRAANPLVRYLEAHAVDVDIKSQDVICVPGGPNATQPRTQFSIPYDILVVAVGETTTTFGVKGAREYAFFLKEISDARRLRQNILDRLEKSALPIWTTEERTNLLHFVVVGGGPTGCEFAGELCDFVRSDLAPRYGATLVSLIRVTLLQSGATLLSQFEKSLQDMALSDFRERVQVRLNARVRSVNASHVVLMDGSEVAYGMLVWAAGNGTREIVGKLIEAATGETTAKAMGRRGKLVTDAWLRVCGLRGVFAAGDCAEVVGEKLPSTAQVAGQQGAFLGRLLSKAEVHGMCGEDAPVLRGSNGRVVNPFRFLSLGIMAYLGNERAVVQVEAGEERTVTVGGSIAYALWRSVYAVKQVDVRNRLLVLFDYFKSRIFGRDISQF